jgi:hypothetical protein
MNTASAFMMGRASSGKERKVFDWAKAARMIRDANATEASAGLQGDWEFTGGQIFRDGKPLPASDTYVYLASTWATPEIEIDNVFTDCYRLQSETPGWDAATYWPEEALAVLRGDAGTQE